MKWTVLFIILTLFLSGCEMMAVGNLILTRDSDGDGLTDKEEAVRGTNPKLVDTDGDTLSDYYEVHTSRTNPLSKNTDNDRYDDAEDKEPTIKNSARMRATITNKNVQINWFNIGTLVLSAGMMGLLNPDTAIAEISGEVVLLNEGDDYTSYVNYDLLIIHNCGSGSRRVMSLSEEGGRLNPGERDVNYFQESITTKVLSDAIPAMLKDRRCTFDANIQNLKYEKY